MKEELVALELGKALQPTKCLNGCGVGSTTCSCWLL
ncbi:hypothetical protein FOTG_17818 [Fusarium oxysporum f. sp. vasinfectum 25433]|uniref:Uncharacterized protein n=1 Tax=Fusarium oxysporum f. sp. vasinfectum 25433 TaxID=1089449 RepID=X0KJB9_FUSOX|nr:hypothetical protein FOTG_17816 [Fusarium oxysporum f. sp. vasinfectum 25433]EXM13744.1 hypothetical protein FOTG_17818 [Fusarium oxysporum f. sp. vasinfectum 25433]